MVFAVGILVALHLMNVGKAGFQEITTGACQDIDNGWAITDIATCDRGLVQVQKDTKRVDGFIEDATESSSLAGPIGCVKHLLDIQWYGPTQITAEQALYVSSNNSPDSSSANCGGRSTLNPYMNPLTLRNATFNLTVNCICFVGNVCANVDGTKQNTEDCMCAHQSNAISGKSYDDLFGSDRKREICDIKTHPYCVAASTQLKCRTSPVPPCDSSNAFLRQQCFCGSNTNCTTTCCTTDGSSSDSSCGTSCPDDADDSSTSGDTVLSAIVFVALILLCAYCYKKKKKTDGGQQQKINTTNIRKVVADEKPLDLEKQQPFSTAQQPTLQHKMSEEDQMEFARFQSYKASKKESPYVVQGTLSRGVTPSAKVSTIADTSCCYTQKVSVHFGINEYKHWPNLGNAVNDAETTRKRFEEVLKFDSSTVVLNEEVTADRIAHEFEELSKIDKGGLIVVTWHGHGAKLKMRGNGKEKGFFVPYDAPKGPIKTKTCAVVSTLCQTYGS